MMERLHRRVSKESSNGPSPPEIPGTPVDQPFQAMDIIHHGHLKADVSLLKARSEYLVLTNQCLVRLGNVEAARGVFPQLGQAESLLNGGQSGPTMPNKSALNDIRLEIPLTSIVATFREEGSSPRFGIEVWWFSAWPRLAYCKAQLFFPMPKERDDWLVAIQEACKVRLRKAPLSSAIPDNLQTRINHIVASTEPSPTDSGSQNLTFPVARRSVGTVTKASGGEEAQAVADMSSYFLVIGSCMCYFVEVLKADLMTLPGDLRVKATAFGTVTLTRFRASVASNEQRFVMSFR